MMTPRLLRVTAFVAASLTSAWSVQASQALRNVRAGEPVPDFAANDLNGKPVAKAAYRGKVLLLVFVRPAHEESTTALRAAQNIFQDNDTAKFAVLAISSKPEARDQLKRLVSEKGIAYPIAMDPERKMYGDFGLRVSPTTLLIDGAGVLRHAVVHLPPNYEQRLRIHIDQLLGKITPKERDSLLARMKAGKRGRLDPAEQRLRLARRLVEQGKHAEAIPVLSRVQQDGTKPKSEKDSVLVTVLLGTAYLGLNKVEEAAKHLDPLAEKTPAPPELKLALARLDLRRGNDEKAEKHLKDALEGSPQKGAVLFELGRLYERQGKPAKALECYRTALEEAYPRDSRSFSQTRE